MSFIEKLCSECAAKERDKKKRETVTGSVIKSVISELWDHFTTVLNQSVRRLTPACQQIIQLDFTSWLLFPLMCGPTLCLIKIKESHC